MGRHVDDLWGIPIVQLRRPALRSAAWRVKRAIDVVASSVLLVLASPVLLTCAIGVRLSSPGPILFRQKRVGQHGELFELLKFRSMRMNDDSDTMWSGAEEDLMTGFGRFMRRTGIDELPQLWNVLRGEMSLVGPRPSGRTSPIGSASRWTAMRTGTAFRSGSPDGHRCTASGATARSRTVQRSTTTTSSSGRCGTTW